MKYPVTMKIKCPVCRHGFIRVFQEGDKFSERCPNLNCGNIVKGKIEEKKK